MAVAQIPSTPKIVHAGRGRFYMCILAPLLAVLVTAGLVYQQVLGDVEAELEGLRQERVANRQALDELRVERTRLYEELAAAERSSQIDREAAKLVRGELKQLKDEQGRMQQELTLLRGVVSDSVTQEGLQVKEFRIEAVSEKRREYRYRFTVSKRLRNGGYATGWISLALDGELAGEPKTLDMKELTEAGTDRLKMRFRHFQDVEGVVQLPQGFSPTSVVVDIKPTTKSLSPLSARLGWQVAG